MKICLKNSKKNLSDNHLNVIKSFLEFLQNKIPVVNDIEIIFLNKRQEGMTTGVRKPHGKINVLSKNRMLIDIMRTIAHEWVHEYQSQILGISKKNKKIKDIGGTEENMANALSGVFIKQFQKNNPDFESQMYGE